MWFMLPSRHHLGIRACDAPFKPSTHTLLPHIDTLHFSREERSSLLTILALFDSTRPTPVSLLDLAACGHRSHYQSLRVTQASLII